MKTTGRGRFTVVSGMLGIAALASLSLASSPHYSLTKTYPLGGELQFRPIIYTGYP